jgi:hypothetical protein
MALIGDRHQHQYRPDCPLNLSIPDGLFHAPSLGHAPHLCMLSKELCPKLRIMRYPPGIGPLFTAAATLRSSEPNVSPAL